MGSIYIRKLSVHNVQIFTESHGLLPYEVYNFSFIPYLCLLILLIIDLLFVTGIILMHILMFIKIFVIISLNIFTLDLSRKAEKQSCNIFKVMLQTCE